MTQSLSEITQQIANHCILRGFEQADQAWRVRQLLARHDDIYGVLTLRDVLELTPERVADLERELAEVKAELASI